MHKTDSYWNALILSTGYVEDTKSLDKYQIDYLSEIKKRFTDLEKKSLDYAVEIFNQEYEDNNNVKDLEISGLNLPQDNSTVWELYIESHAEDKYLIVVVIFNNWEIINHTTID